MMPSLAGAVSRSARLSYSARPVYGTTNHTHQVGSLSTQATEQSRVPLVNTAKHSNLGLFVGNRPPRSTVEEIRQALGPLGPGLTAIRLGECYRIVLLSEPQ
jgi:hypothetical protein